MHYPDHAQHPRYDTALARELLASTGELPDSKRGLRAVLAEYSSALHDLTMPGPGDPAEGSQRADPSLPR